MRSLLITIVCAAAYGYALGSAHSELYATRNLLKFPALLLCTGALCAPMNYVLARVLAPTLCARAVQRSVLVATRDLAVLLASLSPCTLFVAFGTRLRATGPLGAYPLFLGFNRLLVAASGVMSTTGHLGRLVDASGHRAPARRLVLASLCLSLAVGGQAAFYMRPFFGLQATRGGDPPLWLGDAPDARGARNFYEVVWQFVSHPALPAEFTRQGR